MRRPEWLQAYAGWQAGRLRLEEAARLLGVCERTFRRYLGHLQGWQARRSCRPVQEVHDYSHSIVAGGFPEMSYTTREMPLTSLTIRRETWSRNSYGRRAQCAVMKSTVSTARSAIT